MTGNKLGNLIIGFYDSKQIHFYQDYYVDTIAQARKIVKGYYTRSYKSGYKISCAILVLYNKTWVLS